MFRAAGAVWRKGANMKSNRLNGLRAVLAAICAAGVLAGAGCELVDIGDEDSSVVNIQDDHSINQGDQALPERAPAATNGVEVAE